MGTVNFYINKELEHRIRRELRRSKEKGYSHLMRRALESYFSRDAVERKQGILASFDSWQDSRRPEEIVAEIRRARSFQRKATGF